MSACRSVFASYAIIALALAGCSRSPDQAEKASGEEVPSAAATAQADPWALACDKPVRAGESATALLARMGSEARRETVSGPEGMELQAVVLWPADPARRLEVIYHDEVQTAPALLRPGRDSRWQVRGIVRGTSLEMVEARNGRPFALYGFEWDYGGVLNDWMGGVLARMEGGCTLGLRFAPRGDAQIPRAMLGEATLRSDNQALRDVVVEVREFTLSWPAPK